MPMEHRRATSHLAALGSLGWATFIPQHARLALSYPLSRSSALSLYPGAIHQPYAVALAAALVALIFLIAYRRWQNRLGARLAGEAKRLASDGRARAVVVLSVDGLAHLSASRRSGAVKSIRLYLAGFTKVGEAFMRLDRETFGLIVLCEPGHNLTRRLSVLAQDVGFLFLASYPALRLGARIGACRISEPSCAREALAHAKAAHAAAVGVEYVLYDERSAGAKESGNRVQSDDRRMNE